MQSCELAGLRHSSLLGVTRPAVAVMLLTFGSVTAQRGTPPCAPRDLKSMGLTAAAAALTNTSPGRLRMCTGRQSKEHVAPMETVKEEAQQQSPTNTPYRHGEVCLQLQH